MSNPLTNYSGSNLVKVNGSIQSYDQGRYHMDVSTDWIMINPDRIITPLEISRIHYGKKLAESYETYCRQRLWWSYQEAWDRGELFYPMYKLSRFGIIIGIKRFNGDEDDDKYFPIFLDRMEVKAERATGLLKKVRRLEIIALRRIAKERR